jgi:regulator of protease activity HflC (stomatin/prohibitin superfamily)
VQPNNVNRLFQEVGLDYANKIIVPVVEGTIKDIIGKWNAQDLIANREKSTEEILIKLQRQLSGKYVDVTDFQITDINYSNSFEKAIEEKVTAEQEALKAKNKTVQIEEEAKQKVIAAEAEAKSMEIRAQALSQNKSLVQYEAVQKWDGTLPRCIFVNSVPFNNMSLKE